MDERETPSNKPEEASGGDATHVPGRDAPAAEHGKQRHRKGVTDEQLKEAHRLKLSLQGASDRTGLTKEGVRYGWKSLGMRPNFGRGRQPAVKKDGYIEASERYDTTREAAEALSVSIVTVRKWYKRFGLSAKRDGRVKVTEERFNESYSKGGTLGEIGGRLKITAQAVSLRLSKNGMKAYYGAGRRPNGDPKDQNDPRDKEERISGLMRFHHWTHGQATKALGENPSLIWRDQEKLISAIKGVYGWSDSEVSKTLLSAPKFADLNHARVMKDITDSYACMRDKAAAAVLQRPEFAGLDHRFRVWQLGRLGRMVGVDDVRPIVIENPSIACYSVSRHIAALDVGKQLSKEGIPNDGRMLAAWLKYYQESPYVPGTDRQRISHVLRREESCPEPNLMAVLRRSYASRDSVSRSVWR